MSQLPTIREQRVGGPSLSPAPEKVRPWHRDRLAVVYVRQSTAQQVLDHQESTRLQYGLADRAQALGWAAERVLVIDDDLGKSGRSADDRPGFQRLVSEVSLDHVGLILGRRDVPAGALQRDWHQLLELCALFRHADRRPRRRVRSGPVQRSVAAGAEGHDERSGAARAASSGCTRGGCPRPGGASWRCPLPIGYVWRGRRDRVRPGRAGPGGRPPGLPRSSPSWGRSAASCATWREHEIQLGRAGAGGAGQGGVGLAPPEPTDAAEICSNTRSMPAPTSTGGGRTIRAGTSPGGPAAGASSWRRASWLAFVPDQCPAYITWEQYEAQPARGWQANRARAPRRRARSGHGPALLAGLVTLRALPAPGCGVRYDGARHPHVYVCTRPSDRLRRAALPARRRPRP